MLQNVAVIRTLCRKYYAKKIGVPNLMQYILKFITFNNIINSFLFPSLLETLKLKLKLTQPSWS